MIYTQDGERVTLEMTLDDYASLLMIIGFAIGAAYHSDGVMVAWIVRFANELNATNPRYTPYEVPEAL